MGEWLRDERIRRGLASRELARLAGYRRLTKGSRRIERYEQSGREMPAFIRRMYAALGLNLLDVELELEQERRHEMEMLLSKWLDDHAAALPPQKIVVRCFSGFYSLAPLLPPPQSVLEAAVAARSFARRHGLHVCVPLSDTTRVFLDEHGRVEAITEQL